MNNHGDLKSLLSLWENLANNHRYRGMVQKGDIDTFRTRADNEGLPFLTITLPLLGKALDKFHSSGVWTTPEHFKCDGDGIPEFLGVPIRLAIDGNSVAVDCVRQLSYIFYKLEVPYVEEQKHEYLDQFFNTDKDIRALDVTASVPLPRVSNDPELSGTVTIGSIVKEMRGLIQRVLCNKDPLDIRPRHGSGATACRTPNSKKWSSLRYYPKLDHVFDYATYFFFSPTHLADELEKLELSEHKEPRARVCLVPKDSRGPRVISCEPAEYMYIQQGLMRLLYETIETHPLTRGRVNFADQRINQRYAKLGSENNLYATLDLKDASDRVSLDLVRSVFPPDWVEALEACRSEETILPDGRIVKLNKFAPMGSACCFPVEALVFWACAVATLKIFREKRATLRYIEKHNNLVREARDCESSGERFTRDHEFVSNLSMLKAAYSSVKNWLPEVLVYGDDIICPGDFAEDIMVGLEAIGLLVNRDKSYVAGPFRESCGGDYHNGYDVTPVRVRKRLASVGTGLQACADLANELSAKFGYEDAHGAIRVIESAVGYAYPRTELDIPMSIRTSPSASNDVLFERRWNKALQRWEHRCLSITHAIKDVCEPSWSELLRKELCRDRASDVQELYEHPLAIVDKSCAPGQYAVPHSARRKWAWTWLGEPGVSIDPRG